MTTFDQTLAHSQNKPLALHSIALMYFEVYLKVLFMSSTLSVFIESS